MSCQAQDHFRPPIKNQSTTDNPECPMESSPSLTVPRSRLPDPWPEPEREVVSGQWFSGWAMCVPMKAAPANSSDPENILNWGKSRPWEHLLSPSGFFAPSVSSPLFFAAHDFFFPLSSSLISILCHPSRGRSAAPLGSARPWRPSGSQRFLSPVRSPCTAGPQTRELLPRSVARLMKAPPGDGAGGP